jgi:hypothetical protein
VIARRDVLKAGAAAMAAMWLRPESLAAWAGDPLAGGLLWTNKHQNLSQRVWRHYDVWNRAGVGDDAWRGGLGNLHEILADAQSLGRRVRAVGARWSLSPVAMCPDVMINTMPLNYHQLGLPARHVATTAADPSRLVFAQCGARVGELSQSLEARGYALPTSGASNGQTICGAISTGTHGSARRVGSMQDFILGLHLLGEDGRFLLDRTRVPARRVRRVLRLARRESGAGRPPVPRGGSWAWQFWRVARGALRG